jgi:ribonuclease HI
MNLIWNLRNERVLDTHTEASEAEIHNRWVSLMNAALKRDQLLSNRIRFGSLATEKQVVLNTWSGMLLDEGSLPDNWTSVKGVFCGYTARHSHKRSGLDLWPESHTKA